MYIVARRENSERSNCHWQCVDRAIALATDIHFFIIRVPLSPQLEPSEPLSTLDILLSFDSDQAKRYTVRFT